MNQNSRESAQIAAIAWGISAGLGLILFFMVLSSLAKTKCIASQGECKGFLKPGGRTAANFFGVITSLALLVVSGFGLAANAIRLNNIDKATARVAAAIA